MKSYQHYIDTSNFNSLITLFYFPFRLYVFARYYSYLYSNGFILSMLIHINIINAKVTLSVSLLRSNYFTDVNEIWHEDTWIPGEGQGLFQIAITEIYAGGTANKSQFKIKQRYFMNIIHVFSHIILFYQIISNI